MRLDRVHKSVHRIMGDYGGALVFIYLVKGDTTAILDTGSSICPEKVIQPALAEMGMTLADVDLILNTHAHPDHTGGNAEVKRVSGAPIYLHPAELPSAESTDTLVEAMVAPLRALDFPAEAVRLNAENTGRMGGEGAGADVLLSDGQVVDLGAGIKLRVVHNPGHTPGAVSYYWESEGVLVAADAVQGLGFRYGSLPLYFNAANYRRSLLALGELDIRLLCMAHTFMGGGYFNDSIRSGDECKALLRESLQAADAIHRAVEETMRKTPEASKREIALSALSTLVYSIPQLRQQDTGMPRTGVQTLVSHIQGVLDGSYVM